MVGTYAMLGPSTMPAEPIFQSWTDVPSTGSVQHSDDPAMLRDSPIVFVAVQSQA